MSDLTQVIAMQGLAQIAAILIILLGIALIFKGLSSGSKGYRILLADMYVVGTIKKLAEKDGIDLARELHEYSRICKRRDLSEKGLAKVVEEELKEKIADVTEKSLNDNKK